MSMPGVDIIVPVWNRPVEPRECLVNLVRHSPDARLILLSNGCDRETESLLEEFAEFLDERALLISSGVNLGFVRAVNRGLARTEAEFAAVVRSSSLVAGGWLEPLLHFGATREDAGIIVPRLINGPGDRRTHGVSPDGDASEKNRGDFAAMLIRRSLYERIGGFDEEMDGETWCLQDFSRRALTKGLLTYTVMGSPVRFGEEPSLGSLSRREEALARSIAVYNGRWGEERSFCIHFPKDADSILVRRELDIILAGARQGHHFTVMVSPGTFAKLAGTGCASLHGNMALKKYPRIFPDRWIREEIAALRSATPGLVVVAGLEGRVFPCIDEAIPFAHLERLISADWDARYGEAR